MKVQDAMTQGATTCRPETDLEQAVRMMWDRDLGCIPVVDEQGTVVGMLTDRDVCMGVYTQGKRLGDARVQDSMAHEVFWCRPSDSLERALSTMADHQVRRLPVVDGDNRIQGVITVNDLARAAVRTADVSERHRLVFELVEALAAICEPRAASAELMTLPASAKKDKERTGRQEALR
jgi:CBS domain-containing protein